jgi:hypothetical protein
VNIFLSSERCARQTKRAELFSNNIGSFSPYLTGHTLRLRYRAQPVNAVWGNSRCLLWELELEFVVRPTVSRPVSLGIGPPFGTLDQILSCSSFVCQLHRSAFNASSLTRERVCHLLLNCFWVLPEQSHLSRSPTELTAISDCLVWDAPTWRARFPYLYPPGTWWPSYTPGHWVPFLSPLTTRGD